MLNELIARAVVAERTASADRTLRTRRGLVSARRPGASARHRWRRYVLGLRRRAGSTDRGERLAISGTSTD